ncbi:MULTISPECIES: hypothetical protein [unclassified Nodularia (in: cyanobacteria)]|uniref:hypothetical protein n=1 Tax=unclassified Nodularia (in: cyanobacteria) TaxID=2656917 RepID=UPI00187E51B8|nr:MULTISPECIES: hypothetical protein [unclassified Nodularia (in: cyanobacteria)]MBE9200708.1 hypothetical protein [Nodularia sp. LEGE 06071]MCC2692028.1 hypothetical protein [Nodularia sp. LEGE 04288]
MVIVLGTLTLEQNGFFHLPDLNLIMRIGLNSVGKEYQLQLVQETSLELTFQVGVRPKSAALKWARLSCCINLVIAVLMLGFIYVLMTNMANDPNIPNIPSRSFIYYILGIWMIGPIMMLISIPFYKYFTVWTFDRIDQQILKTTTYLYRKDHTDIFSFTEVQSILVEQDHDDGSTSTELYMVRKSGKKITLSKSFCNSNKTSQQASDLKYHQEIAQKMRHHLGL